MIDFIKDKKEIWRRLKEEALLTSIHYLQEGQEYLVGIELFIPKSNGLRLKVELDATNYTEEGREPVIQDSRVNIGLVKPLSENFFVKLAYVRGNTSILGFHIKYMQASRIILEKN